MKFTFDTPSLNQSRKMLVLDIQIWMDKETREVGIPGDMLRNKDLVTTKTGSLKKVIVHMVQRVSNLYRSASPENQKVATVTQEIIRRLKTTSRDLPPEVVESVERRYIDDPRHAVYGTEWRIKSARSSLLRV